MNAGPRYDRKLLLTGAKRNAVLDLSEVQRYGRDSFGDPDYVSIYGLPPAKWYAKGIRLLGRTAVECTRDELADAIGEDIAKIAKTAPPTTGVVVIDPFAGSGNTLYWILRRLPVARGFGFELDARVFQLTKSNLVALNLTVDITNVSYTSGLTAASVGPDELVVAFIAPPWGDALDPVHGLDLRRTTPPIAEIIDFLARRFGERLLLCAIQVYESVDPASLVDVKTRFSWSAQRVYSLNAPGLNHGLLLGTLGWVPMRRGYT